uniref:Uncharacterized protein n=1 Tax=Schistocephalus solidus TaxID=70667 RepID=A0A0X3PHM7_SCHSO
MKNIDPYQNSKGLHVDWGDRGHQSFISAYLLSQLRLQKMGCTQSNRATTDKPQLERSETNQSQLSEKAVTPTPADACGTSGKNNCEDGTAHYIVKDTDGTVDRLCRYHSTLAQANQLSVPAV